MSRIAFIYLITLLILDFNTSFGQRIEKENWFDSYKLSTGVFNNPPLEYAPFTRWWWPGNDVTPEELIREVNLFADNNIGGVEIQAFALVMPAKGKGRGARIMTYDTPAYYENLSKVMEEAASRGMTVDMTNGSGWPAGGTHLEEEDNNLSLEYGMIDIPAGNSSALMIPRANKGDRPNAKLVALLAAKVLKDTSDVNKTFLLDAKSIKNITQNVKDSLFQYTVNEKGWKAIAFWSMATMEKPMLIAQRGGGFVMNHFDSVKVVKNYEHYFGERTGLKKYFGKPFRAVFNDSYEFKADRHFSDDFIATFNQNRGYDITPYLPSNIWYGYNNMYYRMDNPNQQPEFSFGKEDWRLRYDYDLTLSDVIGKHLLKGSANWAASKGLVHRTQTYGPNIDIMATAGLADIPECETMQFNKGSEGAYKLITSGAHLYNRPLISCESAVYIKRGNMTTPQKLKLTLDKVFACGVNHVIWHGTPYKYFPGAYPEEGWYPFMNAYLPINFSSNLNESNPFWKYMKDINGYAKRAQYVLRSGKPQADVLIYYPFLNYSEHTANPNEIFLNGYMKEVEPALPAENITASFNREIDTEWLDKVWPLINELNARGITWDWINDASIQEMSLNEDKNLNVRGNEYQSLILFDLPYIQLKSAENIKKVANDGANILVVGNLPEIQPSYNNYLENDKLTAQAMEDAVKSPSVRHFEDAQEIANWCSSIKLPVANNDKYSFIRQVRRVMDDGSIAQFLWNTSDEYQKVQLKLDSKFKYAAWMNAEDGSLQPATINEGMVEYLLPPLSTIFIYAGSEPIKGVKSEVATGFIPENATEVASLEKWNLECDSIQINDTSLFDWKNNGQMKYAMKEGAYTTTVSLKKLSKKEKYFIDLGKVYFSADLEINSKKVGTRLYAPFNFDITGYLQKGENDIKVTITPTLYNGFTGKANQGIREYKNYKDSELMSQGLIGPVRILKQK
ncbi:glycosyl hydrolase [Plebeiibacterium marinum]|uniref:Glycosyl hydrolase n=1 Tax=Plebeiibacterium marinum TaxID=2992111 RepID=A0AAE3MHJ6_9BACT|nr:glycosyl hydrolase [Plebeiobacterium marinum]MCW3807741.1 glycosyl hydrolase [Plebeiobacterium marinum]